MLINYIVQPSWNVDSDNAGRGIYVSFQELLVGYTFHNGRRSQGFTLS
jgi:hypothetical protein